MVELHQLVEAVFAVGFFLLQREDLVGCGVRVASWRIGPVQVGAIVRGVACQSGIELAAVMMVLQVVPLATVWSTWLWSCGGGDGM